MVHPVRIGNHQESLRSGIGSQTPQPYTSDDDDPLAPVRSSIFLGRPTEEMATEAEVFFEAREMAFGAFETVMMKSISQLESQALTSALAAFSARYGITTQSRFRSSILRFPSLVPLPAHPVISLAADRASTNAWQPPSRVTQTNGEPADTDLESMARKIKGLLNKLTPEKFEKLSLQILDLKIDQTKESLTLGVDLIFDKAKNESHFAEVYASLCVFLDERLDGVGKDTGDLVSFRSQLVSRCREDLKQPGSPAPVLDEEISPEEWELRVQKRKRAMMGNAIFFAELFCHQLVQDEIIVNALEELWVEFESDRSEEALEKLCKILLVSGATLDERDTKVQLKSLMGRLRAVVDTQATSSRTRFMIEDVLDLQEQQWNNSKRVVDKPKKMERFHGKTTQTESGPDMSSQESEPRAMLELEKRKTLLTRNNKAKLVPPNSKVLLSSSKLRSTVLSIEEIRDRLESLILSEQVDESLMRPSILQLGLRRERHGTLIAEIILELSLEKKESQRRKIVCNVEHFVKENLVGPPEFEPLLRHHLESIKKTEEEIDMPRCTEALGESMAFLCIKDAVQIERLPDALKVTPISRRIRLLCSFVANYVAASGKGGSGAKQLRAEFSKMKMNLRDVLGEAFQEISLRSLCRTTGLGDEDAFIAEFATCKQDKGLQGIETRKEQEAQTISQHSLVSMKEEVQSQLAPLLSRDEDANSERVKHQARIFINRKVSEKDTRKRLGWVYVICSFLLLPEAQENIAVEGVDIERRIGELKELLDECVRTEVAAQAECLFVVQDIWASLRFPGEFLLHAFKALYDNDIVELAAYELWREETRKEDDGGRAKEKALFQVNGFLGRVSEMEKDEEDDDDDE